MAKLLRTPVGIAVYPWIKAGKPDTRFDANGLYKIDLDLEDNEDTRELIDIIEAERDKYVEELKSQNPRGKKVRVAELPIEEQEDGKIRFKFKMKARVESKKGTFTQQPAVFDGKGKPMFNITTDENGNEVREAVDVRGGSVVRVAFEAIPYESPMLGVGVTFRLKAVQVQKLVTVGERSAEGYGFGEMEDAYEHETQHVERAEQQTPREEADDFDEGDF
ncbi:TPA: hypothetical protein ACX6Q6_003529 [Photobacterium damselae]